jgi:hypothetical protein
MRKEQRVLRAVGMSLAAIYLVPATASSATIEVDKRLDASAAGECSLRDAVTAANGNRMAPTPRRFSSRAMAGGRLS